MKKLVFTAAILVSCLSFKLAVAQVHLSVGVNIGAQPEWGPVGYDHVDYYYMPDIGAYYDIPAHQYIYLDNGVWIHRAYLPYRWRNYDVYHGYKVVVNRPNPWRYDADYRVRYAGYRGRRDQVIIRDSHEERYRNHWHDNGRHEGWDRGRGHGGEGNGHGRGHGHGHGHDD
ncbi:MAG TPA: hypothetical protein VL442_16280 [Mucilaginibacter sp.]|nr:hypothetical protein [Mucilaginibacter sp.]